MGGYSSARIDGHDVVFGDICEALVSNWGEDPRWRACTFLERSDDGDNWFQFVCAEDYIRGDDTFHDGMVEVYEVRYACKPDDSRFYLADGI